MKNERKFLSTTTFEDIIKRLNSSNSNNTGRVSRNKIPGNVNNTSSASDAENSKEESIISRMRVNRSSND